MQITTASEHTLINDFYGFPEELYHVQYPAKGSLKLAERVSELLPIPIQANPTRGLDHGAWTVLKHLYPQVDVPIVQLSLDRRLSFAEHFALAQKLRPLRDENVLILGSGNIVHNLRAMQPEPHDWADAFRRQINEALQNNDLSTLLHLDRLGKNAVLSVPTPEHCLPLLYVVAQCEAGEMLTLFNDDIDAGAISMTSVLVG